MKNNKVLICNNCKSIWIAPKEKCECGCSTLTETHESNYKFAKNNIESEIKKIVFFKLENGEYITEKGFVISTEMLMKHPHYIESDNGYLIFN